MIDGISFVNGLVVWAVTIGDAQRVNMHNTHAHIQM